MKTARLPRRSVSPFATLTELDQDPFSDLEEALKIQCPEFAFSQSAQLKFFSDAVFIPSVMRRIWKASANDAPELSTLCHYLIQYKVELEAKGLTEIIYPLMEKIFDRKTEIFMIDHYDRAYCEKMGWNDEVRDQVLFSKERNVMVGNYFTPLTERNPGRFSEFVDRWIESKNRDRILHFLDFCSGSKNSSFEYYLLFAHPVLQRILTNKSQLRALFKKVEPLLPKLSSPTWENQVRTTLGTVAK